MRCFPIKRPINFGWNLKFVCFNFEISNHKTTCGNRTNDMITNQLLYTELKWGKSSSQDLSQKSKLHRYLYQKWQIWRYKELNPKFVEAKVTELISQKSQKSLYPFGTKKAPEKTRGLKFFFWHYALFFFFVVFFLFLRPRNSSKEASRICLLLLPKICLRHMTSDSAILLLWSCGGGYHPS